MEFTLLLNLVGTTFVFTCIACFLVEEPVPADAAAETSQEVVRSESSGPYPAKCVLDFISLYNGDYDNVLQHSQPGDKHDLIQGRVVPVDIQCFWPEPVLLAEKVINNDLRITYLIVVSPNADDSVSLNLYTFPNSTSHKKDVIAGRDTNIPCSNYKHIKSCDGSFQFADKDTAFGEFSECYIVEGEYPRYPVTIGCDYVIADAYPKMGYHLVREGEKYPLIHAPPNYVSPCQ